MANNNRRVRIIFTNDYVTFTQRGRHSDRGFIRTNGATVSGILLPTAWDGNRERVFSPRGRNENVPYGDTL
jgi:hypothetical protein